MCNRTFKNRREGKAGINDSKGKDTYGFFLDFSKAFDTCNHKCLEFKLRKLKVGNTLLRAIKRLYKNATAVASVNGCNSKEFPLKVGTAQGCPLSPTLFDVYINDLVLKLERSKHGCAECPVLA